MPQFCVIGLGKFGTAVALNLARKGFDVLVIDKDEDKIREIEDQVAQAIILDVSNEKALRSLKLSDFDYVIIAITQDIEASIFTAMVVREDARGKTTLIAKAATEIHASILRKLGVDRVIFPEKESANRLVEKITSPNIFDYIELSEDYSIAEIKAPESFVGKSIVDLDIRAKYGVYIIAIKRKEAVYREDGQLEVRERIIIIPPPDEEIHETDTLIVIGRADAIERFKEVT